MIGDLEQAKRIELLATSFDDEDDMCLTAAPHSLLNCS